MAIRTVLADDHKVVRDGLKTVINCIAKDIFIIGEASDGNGVLELAKKNPVDVFVMDISMPSLNGIETTRKLKKLNPASKIIILSMHDEKHFIEKALNAGAKGYILKESAADEVIQAIREVYQGRAYISSKISNFVVRGFLGRVSAGRKAEKPQRLTGREKEILQLIAEGCLNKEIARKLNISLNTVHVHRNKIMDKLNIHRQAELIRYALKEGITSL